MRIDKCNFCCGNAKLSTRQKLYLGITEFGEKKIEYATQVICNKCHARGPLVTYINYTGINYNKEAKIEAEMKAIDLWNRPRSAPYL